MKSINITTCTEKITLQAQPPQHKHGLIDRTNLGIIAGGRVKARTKLEMSPRFVVATITHSTAANFQSSPHHQLFQKTHDECMCF